MNQLESLKQKTSVVADTGDMLAIQQSKPEDATTNPSLILKASELETYQPLIEQIIEKTKNEADSQKRLTQCSDRLAVNIGCEILPFIPGFISTEVDARLSFDTQAMVDKAKLLIELYAQNGVNKDRILIKIAATWEGIKAAEILEKQGIKCNLTLLFSMAQAQACADAGAYLISPFVGRILDWYNAQPNFVLQSPEQDPGVQSVKRIFNYYKTHSYSTIVMGASFRNTDQIIQLAGCDKLTISPELLAQLEQKDGELELKLDKSQTSSDLAKTLLNESDFRWSHNEDAMATEKLAEGIRRFAVDQVKLEQKILTLMDKHA